MAASKWTIKGLIGITMVRTLGMVKTLWTKKKKICYSIEIGMMLDELNVCSAIAQDFKHINWLTTIDLWLNWLSIFFKCCKTRNIEHIQQARVSHII